MTDRHTCSVYGCMNRHSDKSLTFFKLPANPATCKKWLHLIARSDLLNKSDLKPSSYKVCSVHFEESAINIIKQLKPGTIPTKNLPNDSEYAPTPSEKTVAISTQSKDSSEHALSVVKIEECPDTETVYTQTNYSKGKNQGTQTSTNLSANTPKKRKLSITSEKNITKLQKKTVSKNITQPEDEITVRFHKLIEWQSNIKNKFKGNRYTSEYKFFALNLFFSSPQTYRTLTHLLKLPSESTLVRMKMHITPKFGDSILNCINTKIKYLPSNAKYCTICVDGLVLNRYLHYDKQADQIIGLHNINGKITKETAAYAYVIMLRGIAVDWKQPLAYALLASPKNYEELDDWMTEIITKLLQLGIKIIAMVSDQSSNFDKYAKLTKQITIEKPYFMINHSKIYYIFDVSHLIKCIRNNLLANDFYWEDKKVSWCYLKTLYTQQKEQNLCLIPKITESHINPNTFQKKRLKYATQIFSRSVYGALNTFIYAKLLPEEARPTAEFVLLMNNLFDILNSSKVKANNIHKSAFSGKRSQIEILNKAKRTFQSMKTVNTVTGVNNTSRIKAFKNILITIQSLIMIFEDLQKENLECLFTRRFNKNPLEAFFGSVRQQRGNSQDPTPIQFMRAFSKEFLCNMLKQSSTSNCEADLCDWLLSQNQLEPRSYVFHGLAKPKIISKVLLQGEYDYCINMPNKNALIYVAGYLLFKCARIHKCADLDTILKDSHELHESGIFRHFKNFNRNKSFYGNLKMPPASFLEYVKQLESIFLQKFKNIMLANPGNQLYSMYQNENFMPLCSCFPVQYLHKLFIRMRIFAIIKFNNRHFRENTKFFGHCVKLKQL